MKRLSLLAIVGALSLAACSSNGASSVPTTDSARSASFLGGLPATQVLGSPVSLPTPTPTPAARAAQFLGGLPATAVGVVDAVATAVPTPKP